MYHLLYRVPRFSILANLSSSSWFKIFLIAHAVIWTLLPYFTRQSLHHDVLEGIAQGLQFQWGYSKHPFLSMWVLAYLWKLFEHQEFFLYAFAQGLIVLSLIYVWRLNRILLPLNQAFMASVSLECFSYYGLDAHILTPDSFQIPLWVMSIYYFYQALEQNRWQDWCVLGLISALGVMVKYQFLILLLTMLVFMLCQQKYRRYLGHRRFYFGALCFLGLLFPHIYWLLQSHFLCLDYIKLMLTSKPEFSRFYLERAYFMNVLLLIAPLMAALSFGLTRGPKAKAGIFLFFAAWGPLIANVFLVLILKIEIYGRWLTPVFSFIPAWFIASFGSKIEFRDLKKMFIMVSLTCLGFALASLPVFNHNPRCDAYYPNKEIAHFLANQWTKVSDKPLAYIGGSRYLVASVQPYLGSEPKPYFSLLSRFNPWIDEAAMKQAGGILVWDEDGRYAWDQESLKYLHPKPPYTNLPIYHEVFYTSKAKPIAIAYQIIFPQNF